MTRNAITRHGKEVSSRSEQEIVDAALAALARQEAEGYGQLGNGRFQKGAPVRITASGLARDLDTAYPIVEAVLDRHFAAKSEGNKVFYTIEAGK